MPVSVIAVDSSVAVRVTEGNTSRPGKALLYEIMVEKIDSVVCKACCPSTNLPETRLVDKSEYSFTYESMQASPVMSDISAGND